MCSIIFILEEEADAGAILQQEILMLIKMIQQKRLRKFLNAMEIALDKLFQDLLKDGGIQKYKMKKINLSMELGNPMMA